ncbi:hypothetical protein SASPL_118700 [Salvia splendens]|uniref:Uncharacterized protein n=1 Tax=Salvia splendens TaxID=180675 RepID=A0A8X8Y0V2_SALSN|nr:uncharacterized protein LOC121809157 [Salvia splendens]KAG6422137.1 hypothetical protein SASPL_118700 [Salvia splendens]
MDYDSDNTVQKQLDAAMPWVGLYIAAASALCILAMSADAFNSFRRKQLWFPCKYTSLNGASLTLLAVAMKLPMDINTVMINSETDTSAKFTSLLFMFTALNIVMPSLGSMNDKDLLTSCVGLALLVVTITANIAIHTIEVQRFLSRAMIPSVAMLVSLAMLVCLALSVSAMKRSLKQKYEEKHREALEKEEELVESFKMDDQRRQMMKYWVMAESSCPQFVIARSCVCAASSMITSFFGIIYTVVHVLEGTSANAPGKTPYGVYTKRIVAVQSHGVGIAVILAMLRWLVALVFRCSSTNTWVIESYWIQTLNDCRNSSAGIKIGPKRWGKCLFYAKWSVLTFCIGVQSFIVLASKTLIFISGFMLAPLVLCCSHINMYVRRHHDTSSGDDDLDLNYLSSYVLLLDGEVKLPTSLVRSMCREADGMIKIGREKKPSNLLNLLHKSDSSNTSQIATLVLGLAHDCWTLQVVTLTSIAFALPNISQHQRKQLLSSVSEGLSLATTVEKTLDTNAKLKSIRNAASSILVELLVYSKWAEIDLRTGFLWCRNSKQVLQELSDKSEEIVMELKSESQDSNMGNPLNFPVRVVAANSMHRICQTILLSYGEEESCEEMWERLCVMIADVLVACLTNLPHVIMKMCHQSCIRKRDETVHEAFLLLGKTEEVVGIVRRQRRLGIDHDEEALTMSSMNELAVTVDC